MPKIDADTKARILAAAEKVFHANGLKGTRTTMIAEEAGISRTMLHYHYSTKEALFEEVMNNTMNTIFKHLQRLVAQENLSIEQLIETIIETMADLFEEKPGLPSFISRIMSENPDLALLIAGTHEDTIPQQLEDKLKIERENGTISEDATGENVIMDLYSLCSMPYIGEPYIKAKENRDDEQFKAFMRERRKRVKNVILKSLLVRTLGGF